MRIEKVVVGIDFSRPGVDAARWVMRHFAPDAEIILAHVIDPPRTPSFLVAGSWQAEVMSSLRNDAASRLREIANSLTAAGARTVVRVGPPHEELAKLAAEIGADLVAVGPHGDRPRPWKMLGTTAERVVRAAAPAALVVANAGATPRRLLAAVDDAPIASTVLAWTKDIAEALGADVTVLHVLETTAMGHIRPMMASGSDKAEPSTRVSTDARREATRWLEALADAALGRGRAKSMVSEGHAGDSILETARDFGAGLIVIGRRGSGTLIPAVVGSTVSTVLHGAPCAVLVVTEEPYDWSDSAAEEA